MVYIFKLIKTASEDKLINCLENYQLLTFDGVSNKILIVCGLILYLCFASFDKIARENSLSNPQFMILFLRSGPNE